MGLIRAGSLDRAVHVVRRGPVVDNGYTKKPGPWRLLCRRHASVKPAQRREQEDNQGLSARREISVWLRHDSITRTIAATDGIVFEGRLHLLTAEPIELGRREGLEVLAVAADPAESIDVDLLEPVA